MKKYCFTGDVKKLKTIGYKFQKMYARNYKAYVKGHLIMYVISKMAIELSDVESEFRNKFINYILKNKNKEKEFWLKDIVHKDLWTLRDMPVWCISGLGEIMTTSEYEEKRYVFTDNLYSLYRQKDSGKITKDEFESKVKQLREKHSAFLNSIPVFFNQEIVNQIIELDNLHPLELLEF